MTLKRVMFGLWSAAVIMSVTLCFMGQGWAMEDATREVILERIRPLGGVHAEVKETPAVVQPAALVVGKTGEVVFQQYCSICHEAGVAGAPRVRNKTDWEPRLKQAGSIEALLKIVNEGLNAMPPKGTCQVCSQDELKHAIEYMLPK